MADVMGQPTDERTPARNLCAVIDEREGLALIDVTEPGHPRKLFPRPNQRSRGRRDNLSYRGLELRSHVDLAEPQGGTRTREGDYAYVLVEAELRNRYRSTVSVLDVSNPEYPRQRGETEAGYATEHLSMAAFYNPPFLQSVLFSPGEQGVLATDVSVSAEPRQLGSFSSLRDAYVIAVEEFPLDKMRDESGRPLKDVSHQGSRWMYLAEIERVLGVPGEVLGTVTPGERAPEVPGMTARLHLASLDRDRSGLLEGDEYGGAGGELVDANADGRISLSELADVAGLNGDRLRTESEVEEASPFLTTRVDADGDLSRLLDGINPYEFDADDDDRLDRDEMEGAFHAALDLDKDGGIDQAELSRHPGELRQLRYGGAWAERRFAAIDVNKDGRISRRELRLEERDWKALDDDRDGYVQLAVKLNKWWELRGFVGPDSEWPTRQPVISHLPPVVTVERVLEVFDANRDQKISLREMRGRPDLFYEFDADGNDTVELDELTRRVDVIGAAGVDVTADDFQRRWDLDGNGKVEPEELPPAARIPARRSDKSR